MEQQAMKSALQRTEHVFSKRPEVARSTKVSKASVRQGLRCEFTEDQWKLAADMPSAIGGTDTGPTPGTLIRAALTSCLAIGYSMRAALLGVPIRGIEVELHADSDLRGIFCGQAAAPIYSDLAFVVVVDSDAPESDVLRVLDEADERSPYLNLFRKAQPVRREVRIQRATATA
jgi:uncharacterized OsmC-like protein